MMIACHHPNFMPWPGIFYKAMQASQVVLLDDVFAELDVDRTRTLAWEVFIHRRGLPDAWAIWPYRAVLGVPSYYAWVYYALYQADSEAGRDEEAARNMERAEAWARLGI